jgi:hypothetical protein
MGSAVRMPFLQYNHIAVPAVSAVPYPCSRAVPVPDKRPLQDPVRSGHSASRECYTLSGLPQTTM